jgi:MFS family permease
MGMLLTFNAIYSLLSTPIGILSDKIGRRRMILFGWLLYALIYLGFALSKTGSSIWVLFGLYGIYYAFTEGSGKALIADFVPDEKRGTAYGLYAMAIGLTALPASAIAGLLWQGAGAWAGFGAPAPFFFGAIMSLLAGLLFWAFVK